MVFDLNKCIGCQTCSVACKVLWTNQDGGSDMWWCTVNTSPGQGTPRGWEKMGGGYDSSGKLQLGKLPTPAEFGELGEYSWEEVWRSGTKEHLHPQKNGSGWAMNWDEDQGAGEYPNAYFFYLPRICNHCAKPACVEACPNDAMYKREDFGLVLRDETRCKGAQQCARACPYKKIYFNQAERISQHCIGCFPRLEKGVAPACVRQCPGRAAFIGYRDDEEGPIHKLVGSWRVALPLHPEFNTDPNVFYVPPLSPFVVRPDGTVDESRRRIPMDALRSLFGNAVNHSMRTLESEMAKRRRGEASELIDLLIGYQWSDFLGPFEGDPAEIIWD
jgi:ethylbenzene hydroxylase subunit beta/complex iron-sulfur molybdoenzyme family reductase subunit beta